MESGSTECNKKTFTLCPIKWNRIQKKIGEFLASFERLKKSKNKFYSGGEAAEHFLCFDPPFVVVHRYPFIYLHLINPPLLHLKWPESSLSMIDEDHPYLIILRE
jgi:hypothetical protein